MPVDKPLRCSWCFGKFMHNHRPKAVQEADGSTRYMHNSCAQAYKDQSKLVWPEVRRQPDRDEP